ncbi:MAG TPA: invasion associated locus B family protein [Rhizomicrobium sp.]|nr:invasion associated locus B family protein [Rhizomicrobium sp.]
MTAKSVHIVLIAAAILFAATGASRADDNPVSLGMFKDWSAYTTTSPSFGKVCYTLAQPRTSDPRNVKRDSVYFLISDWPTRKTKAEPEIVPGYPYKDDSKVTVEVGSDKFELFTKNEGDSGSAWVEQNSDEKRLIEAMRRGQQAIVTGTSARGTLTRDTYSLAGLSAALAKMHSACGM